MAPAPPAVAAPPPVARGRAGPVAARHEPRAAERGARHRARRRRGRPGADAMVGTRARGPSLTRSRPGRRGESRCRSRTCRGRRADRRACRRRNDGPRGAEARALPAGRRRGGVRAVSRAGRPGWGDERGGRWGSCHARLGRDACQAGRPGEAVEHYQRAVDAWPDRNHWVGMAIAYAGAGDLCAGPVGSRAGAPRVPERPGAPLSLADVQERRPDPSGGRDTLQPTARAGDRPQPAAGPSSRSSSASRGWRAATGARRASTSSCATRAAAGSTWVDRSTDNLERAYESLGRDFGVFPKDRVQVGIYVTKTFAELGGIPPEFAEHVLGSTTSRSSACGSRPPRRGRSGSSASCATSTPIS